MERLDKHEALLRAERERAEIGVYDWLGQAQVQGWISVRKSLVERKNWAENYVGQDENDD